MREVVGADGKVRERMLGVPGAILGCAICLTVWGCFVAAYTPREVKYDEGRVQAVEDRVKKLEAHVQPTRLDGRPIGSAPPVQ